jgi:iron complex transport system substrate-binding protein
LAGIEVGDRTLIVHALRGLALTSLLPMLLALLALLALSTHAAAQTTVVDDRGHASTWAQAPQRVVSLLPSLTESVCALGACRTLVGVDRYSNQPPQVDALPKLGGLDDAQVERIVALKPDVVLVAKSARVTDRLESLGLKVVALQSDSHADVKRSLALLAQLLGQPAEADRVWARIEDEFVLAQQRVPARLRGQRVYFEVAATPYAAGSASFIGQTLQRLGMSNIVPPEMGPFPQLNPEFVVRSQPDIVMVAQRELAGMASRPGWRGLLALTPQRSCGFDAPRYELLTRPGPRMGQAALALADCLVGLQNKGAR